MLPFFSSIFLFLCSCDLPHTLRCDGDLPSGEKDKVLVIIIINMLIITMTIITMITITITIIIMNNDKVLAKLVEQVANLPDNRRVALLDLSVSSLNQSFGG